MKESALLFFAIRKNLGETLIVYFLLFDKKHGEPLIVHFSFFDKKHLETLILHFTFRYIKPSLLPLYISRLYILETPEIFLIFTIHCCFDRLLGRLYLDQRDQPFESNFI